jgi:hypothetical protein
MNCKLSFIFLLLFFGCKQLPTGDELSSEYLDEKNFIADNTINNQLDSIIAGINCLARISSTKHFVLTKQYNSKDTNQILIISFRKKSGTGNSSGFSDIDNRCVFICPAQIKDFVQANSLSDTIDITGYLSLILLHELGHYIYRLPGNFDEGSSAETKISQLGEQDLGLSPEVMTYNKKKELQVDSIAIDMIKKGASITTDNCFDIAFKTEMAISGAEFTLFGKRLIGEFGTQTPGLIRDHNWTHPNIELRLAFMNYYLNPTEQKREQIDDYLYNREVAPINRQLTDPRIYQGDEKING